MSDETILDKFGIEHRVGIGFLPLGERVRGRF
jgi:hypothetical protein